MFDDQPINRAVPPANLPTDTADDMFAGVEKDDAPLNPPAPVTPDALSAGILKKKENILPAAARLIEPQPVAPASLPSAMYNVKEPILGKILITLLLMVVIAGLAWGGYWFYSNYYKRADANLPAANPVSSSIPEVAPSLSNVPAPVSPAATDNTAVPNQENVGANTANNEILFGEPVDSDQDGLDDAREGVLGTNPANKDSDNDGLSDGDEVIIWKTNPLNPDSDGDTHPDGKEVNLGYNPLGPGRLFEASSTANSSTNP